MSSNQQIIPPAHIRVKAGFVVYTPDLENRNIVILEEGELAAVDRSDGLKKIVFKMHPGDLVGVAALLEREPFRYTIEATQDSSVTLVTEECLESEFKTLPVWLLAVIKSLSFKTKKLKDALRQPRCTNTVRSLAEFCSHKAPKKVYPMEELIQEFHWITRIPEKVIQADFKALARRHLLEINKKDSQVGVSFASAPLLKIYVDYQEFSEQNKPWPPFQLTLLQKRLLVKLSTIDQNQKMDAPSWLAFFEKSLLKIDVAEWIRMLQLGWFESEDKTHFKPNTDKIKYYLTALRFETNIRGIL